MEAGKGTTSKVMQVPAAPGSAGEVIVGGPSPPSPSLRRTGEMLLGTVGLVSLFAACSASGPTRGAAGGRAVLL